MKYIIDRLEEEMAVCENESREMIPLPLKELPPGAQEGDVILEQEGVFCVDAGATEKRRRQMRRKLMDLYE